MVTIRTTEKTTYMHPHAEIHDVLLTLTLQSLLDQTPQQTPTVVTKGGAHVIVGLKAVWHVNFKALLLKLNTYTNKQTNTPSHNQNDTPKYSTCWECYSYHSVTTVGCCACASANDFINTLLMNSCIAFCENKRTESKKNQTKTIWKQLSVRIFADNNTYVYTCILACSTPWHTKDISFIIRLLSIILPFHTPFYFSLMCKWQGKYTFSYMLFFWLLQYDRSLLHKNRKI